MPSDDSARRVPLGPLGGYLIRNLSQVRGRLTYRELSDRLSRLGRPIPTLGLSRIEKGDRRVDIDDLIALSIALGVSPIALLIPEGAGLDEEIDLTPALRMPARGAWEWLTGASPLPENSVVTWPRRPQSPGEGEMSYSPERGWMRAVGGRWVPSEPPPQAALDYIASLADRPTPVEEALDQPVATAIVTADGRVLVGRRNDGKPPWTFIAGEVEPGESPADAAVREVKEETGLRVELAEVIGERVHPKTGRTMIYIAARPTHGTEIFVGDEDELAEVRWVTLAEADEFMAAYGMFGPVHDYLEHELGEV
jgi:8-oxo-dGTP pyrophosphatase MutT (NUDIX family)